MAERDRRHRAMVLARRYSRGGRFLTLEQASRACGLHPEILVRLRTWGLIEPLEEGRSDEEALFDPGVVMRVKKIVRLRRDLGVNLPGVGVVLELLERIESLEARIRELEGMLEDR